MWSRPEKPVVIHPSQLQIGVFVWIDLPWNEHPFLYNKFRISSQAQLDDIASLGLSQVYYFPNKSSAEPGPKSGSYASTRS